MKRARPPTRIAPLYRNDANGTGQPGGGPERLEIGPGLQGGEDQDGDGDGDGRDLDPVARPETVVLGTLAGGRKARPHQEPLGEDEGQDPQSHADAGRGEAEAPAHALAQGTADQGRQEGPQVDPHVEDRVGPVAPVVALRIECPDHGRDVGLEEAIADDQETQSQRQKLALGQGELAQGHQDPADEDRLALAEVAVGQASADQRGQVDESRVDRIDVQGVRPSHPDGLGQVEHQQCSHPVVAEPLPHLRGEQGIEAGRMSFRLGGDGNLVVRRLSTVCDISAPRPPGVGAASVIPWVGPDYSNRGRNPRPWEGRARWFANRSRRGRSACYRFMSAWSQRRT